MIHINVIIEGCDCVGKTSIIKELNKFCLFDGIEKFSAPKDYIDGMRLNLRIFDLLSSCNNMCLDRGMLGELVYGSLLRYYYASYVSELEKRLHKRNVLVLVDCHKKEVLKRFDGKFITEKQIPQVLQRFKMEFIQSEMKTKIYVNTTHITPKEAAVKIFKDLQFLVPNE